MKKLYGLLFLLLCSLQVNATNFTLGNIFIDEVVSSNLPPFSPIQTQQQKSSKKIDRYAQANTEEDDTYEKEGELEGSSQLILDIENLSLNGNCAFSPKQSPEPFIKDDRYLAACINAIEQFIAAMQTECANDESINMLLGDKVSSAFRKLVRAKNKQNPWQHRIHAVEAAEAVCLEICKIGEHTEEVPVRHSVELADSIFLDRLAWLDKAFNWIQVICEEDKAFAGDAQEFLHALSIQLAIARGDDLVTSFESPLFKTSHIESPFKKLPKIGMNAAREAMNIAIYILDAWSERVAARKKEAQQKKQKIAAQRRKAKKDCWARLLRVPPHRQKNSDDSSKTKIVKTNTPKSPVSPYGLGTLIGCK